MPVKRQTERRFYRVLIGHNALDPGETFGADPDSFGWWESMKAAGYVEEVHDPATAAHQQEVPDAGQEGNG